ncbi:ABC transporter permease [Acinetobacter gerneri]|uniref:ABC transporter permease n=1 Tax=Acinetobacter gerneri TaxID=202952 RepID=UPI002936C534|nr:ABC transporter permease [Acinetobacter gerneri]MDV2441626.1 ABC transporter permease [Acinetobacter gerneri]
MRINLQRIYAVFIKEIQQMLRDRLTILMLIFVPLLQLIVFGYAINTNPKFLPTAIVYSETGPLTRSIISDIENTRYFKIQSYHQDPKIADQMLLSGKVQFIITFPPRFESKMIRGEHPEILLLADATDSLATINAVSALKTLSNNQLNRYTHGVLSDLQSPPTPFSINSHLRYNPENETRFNIVPGLVGIILTMTMVILTSLSITKERESGTMENLLSTALTPIELMLAKILPYIIMGYIQCSIILIAAKLLFDIPIQGNLGLLLVLMTLFIFVNLSVGFTLSTLAKNQLQAMQMAFFFLLPSILLSGFMFPFKGMPEWAQALGQILPLTHFMAIIRGILLKGNGFFDLFIHIQALIIFLICSSVLSILCFKKRIN